MTASDPGAVTVIHDTIRATLATAPLAPRRYSPLGTSRSRAKSSNQSRCSPASWALMMRDAMKAKVPTAPIAVVHKTLEVATVDSEGRMWWSECPSWISGLEPNMDTITLWRPVGPVELALLRQSGMTAFPPRLPDQPIFYPVLSEDYAVRIARDWNVSRDGAGYVTQFEVLTSFLAAYIPQEAGGQALKEYWIPAEDLEKFNEAIVGKITVVRAFEPTQNS